MTIQPITMPKWGLAMQEGTLAKWSVEEGQAVAAGQEIADIETSKIANVYESPVGGVLRRRVAGEGDVLPVGALLATFPTSGAGVSVIDIAGLPTRDELIVRYIEQTSGTGRFVDAHLATWYQVLASYRLGIILEGTNARAWAGLASREIGDQLHATTLALFSRACELISS